jgi:DNA-binding CsgD family transcriptional regulator
VGVVKWSFYSLMKKGTKILMLVFLFLVESFYLKGQSSFDLLDKKFDKLLAKDPAAAKTILDEQHPFKHHKKNLNRYYLNCAAYNLHISEYNLTNAYIDSARKNKTILTTQERYEIARLSALIQHRNGNYKHSLQLIYKCLSDFNKGDQLSKNKLLRVACDDYIGLGEFEKAKSIAFRILKNLTNDEEAKDFKVSNYFALSNIYLYQAKYDSSLYYNMKAATAMQPEDNRKSTFYGNAAQVYAIKGDIKRSIYYYKKSVQILKKMNNTIHLVHAYYNLGDSYKERNIDSALCYNRQAYRISKSINYALISGYAAQNLGDIFLERKELDSSFYYNNAALTIFTASDNQKGILHVQLNLSKFYLERENLDEALRLSNDALVLAQSMNSTADLSYCYEYLYKVYEKKADFSNALKYHKLYQSTLKKIMNKEVLGNIQELDIKYESELNKKKNLLIKKELQIEAGRKRIILIILLFVFISLVILFILYRQKNKINKLSINIAKSELAKQKMKNDFVKNELETTKNQLLDKINLIKELDNFIQSNQIDGMSKVEISKIASDENEWLQFISKLQLLFPDFRKNIEAAHSNLSKTEFRLVALTKLNLSDKEISSLLNIEVSSVKKSKMRLKKKMDLTDKVKLEDYIKSF